MKFEKKMDVEYVDGGTITHTFKVLSGDARNNIFGEYLDMKGFMGKSSDSAEKDPMKFIKEDKNILNFTTAVLQAGCPTLDTDKIPASICDKLFEELSDFLFTGGLKN